MADWCFSLIWSKDIEIVADSTGTHPVHAIYYKSDVWLCYYATDMKSDKCIACTEGTCVQRVCTPLGGKEREVLHGCRQELN